MSDIRQQREMHEHQVSQSTHDAAADQVYVVRPRASRLSHLRPPPFPPPLLHCQKSSSAKNKLLPPFLDPEHKIRRDIRHAFVPSAQNRSIMCLHTNSTAQVYSWLFPTAFIIYVYIHPFHWLMGQKPPSFIGVVAKCIGNDRYVCHNAPHNQLLQERPEAVYTHYVKMYSTSSTLVIISKFPKRHSLCWMHFFIPSVPKTSITPTMPNNAKQYNTNPLKPLQLIVSPQLTQSMAPPLPTPWRNRQADELLP